MSLRQTLKKMGVLFCVATTFLFLVLGLHSAIFFSDVTYTGRDILTGLLMAFLVTLPTLVFVNTENASHRSLIIRQIIHFLLTMGFMSVCLMLFQWVILDMEAIIYAFLFFFVVYLIGFIITFLHQKRVAEELNKRINAFHNAENETHGD